MKPLIFLVVIMTLAVVLLRYHQINSPASTYALNNVQECANKISENNIRMSFLKPLKNNPTDGEANALHELCEEALQKQELDLALKKSS